MSNEILTIGLSALSILVSVTIAYRQTNVQIQSLKVELQQQFSSKLFEKRLEVYPELFSFISDFIKTIQFGEITNKKVSTLLDKIQSWDSKNAILFSGETGIIAYRLRKLIVSLSKLSDSELTDRYKTEKSRDELRERLQQLELALKTELGIYSYKTPTTVTEPKFYKTYDEVFDDIGRPRS